MKLIVISGAKHSKKEILANKLADNSDCIWVHPYTNKKRDAGFGWEHSEYIHLNDSQLSSKMEKEIPLVSTNVNGFEYVFFETQFRADYCVIIGDDSIVSSIRNNWNGDVVTVKCHADEEKYSERNLLGDDEFDFVFNVDYDDYDTFEAMII